MDKKEELYIRKCPKCNRDLIYSSKYTYRSQNKKNSLCNKCCKTKHFVPNNLIKTCIGCGSDIVYKSKTGYYKSSDVPCCPKCLARKYTYSEVRKRYWDIKENRFRFSCSRCNKTVFLKSTDAIKKAIKSGCCGLCREKERISNEKIKHDIILKEKKDFRRKLILENRKKRYDRHLSLCETERTCKQCGKKSILKRPLIKNSNFICRSCILKLKWDDVDYRTKQSKKISQTYRDKWKNDIEFKRLRSEYQLRPDVSRKKREKMVDRIKTKFGQAGVNLKACNFIDLLNETYKWNLEHALRGGEKTICGYFLDGYDKEKNIIFEYDEPHHYYASGELKKDDLTRQNNIIEFFKIKNITPIFIRYDEKRKCLYTI